MKSTRPFAVFVLVFVSLCVFLPSPSAARTNGEPERFTAMAINMGSPGRAGANQVELVVNRWSTEAERNRLLQALFDKGSEELLETLVDLPRAGYFRTPTSTGYDLHCAHREKLSDGGERIVLATDRYINFWEARNKPRSIDYPFTVIELHFNGDGKGGEGKMAIATKITGDKQSNNIVLENYATQPVMLNDVRRQKK